MIRETLLAVVVTTILLVSCHDKKATSVPGSDKKENTTREPDPSSWLEDQANATKERLSKLTPLTEDQLKALIPSSLFGAPATEVHGDIAMGVGIASADYHINDSSTCHLSIYDCAGSAGAGMYNMQYLGMMNMNQETENDYTKTIDFNGGKAFEHGEKQDQRCSLTFFAADRYLVIIDGSHIDMADLKKAASELKLK